MSNVHKTLANLASNFDVLPNYTRSASLPIKFGLYFLLSILAIACLAKFVKPFRTILVFAYTCFLQPIGKHSKQSERLDAFYQNQATGE